MRSERGRPALVASARARCPRSQEKCEHLPEAKQLTRDIYDRIIQINVREQALHLRQDCCCLVTREPDRV
jgi:hypothetical protein